MMTMMMDMNWHMGSLRRGLEWSSDGGGGSCQPHIDHHPHHHHHHHDKASDGDEDDRSVFVRLSQ